MMKMINRLLDALDIAGRLFERLLYLAAAIGGAVLGWIVFGALDYAVVVQFAGAVMAGLAGALLAWIAWKVMYFFHY